MLDIDVEHNSGEWPDQVACWRQAAAAFERPDFPSRERQLPGNMSLDFDGQGAANGLNRSRGRAL
jgi:hypothetical protein